MHRTAQHQCQGTFFREVILHQFLKRKNRALLSKNVQAILTLLNLAQKVPFLEDLKKKVSKSDWNQRHIVYVTQIHYYTWFQITFGPKNAIILAKNYNFPFFKNSHFWLFYGVLEVKLKFQDKFYDIINAHPVKNQLKMYFQEIIFSPF